MYWARFNKHFEDESKFFSLSVKQEVLGKKTSKSLMKSFLFLLGTYIITQLEKQKWSF